MAPPADTEGAELKGAAVLLEQTHTGTSVRATAAAWQNPDMQLLSESPKNLRNCSSKGFTVKLKCSETLMQILSQQWK